MIEHAAVIGSGPNGLAAAIALARAGRRAAVLGAGLVLLGDYALDSIGVAALAVSATAIVAAPVLWLAPRWATLNAARDPW